MTFERIQQLIQTLPSNSSYFEDIYNYTTEVPEVNKFLHAYKNLRFGYCYVHSIIEDGQKLPDLVEEEALIKLYNLLKFGISDSDILFAISLTDMTNKNMEDTIKAMLMSDASYEEISKITAIPPKVLELYGELFFNIRDRKKEALFIANVVYPNSRMIEQMEGYTKNEDFGKLMLRAAYNNGIEDVAYFSGLKTESLISSGMTAADAASRLENMIMLNGLFLSRNGFLNQRNATGVAQAKNIIMASKQSGQDNTSSQDLEGVQSLGEQALLTLKEIKGPEVEELIRLEQDLAESGNAKPLENN